MCVSNGIMFNTDVVFVKTSSDITLPYHLLVFYMRGWLDILWCAVCVSLTFVSFFVKK